MQREENNTFDKHFKNYFIIIYDFRPPTFKNATQKNNDNKKPVTVKIDRGRTEITGMELRKRSQSAGPGREKLLLGR